MPILEVRGLEKWYGRRKVVDGVSFEVNAGEVVGLLGPNGAGKTTSFRMTTGQITPQGGKVTFAGHDVTSLPMYRRARLGMGYLPQESSIFRGLTVEQNILAILEAMPGSRSLGRKLTRAERNQRTADILDGFGLGRLRQNNAGRLSGGEKRRLEIARCLVCEPLLILLDEPFTGIDPKTIADIQQIVLDLRRQGIAILLTDHNVRETLKITDRSYLIKDGTVRTHGSPQQIVHDPVAIAEYLGAGFHDDPFSRPTAAPSVTVPVIAPGLVTQVSPAPDLMMPAVEQENLHRLIEKLRTGAAAEAAAELVRHGRDAVVVLLDALDRRDVELRRQALNVLQTILPGGVVFDPYAPESLRKQQLTDLREQFFRKAG